VGSTLEARVVADEIRREIDASAVERHATTFLTKRGYLSSHSVEYFTALLNAKRHENWNMIMAGSFACLLLLMAVGADRMWRQRKRIAATGEALRQMEQKLRSWRTT
jgi:hypothetical protein